VADRDFAHVQATVKPDESVPGVSGLRAILLAVGMVSAVIMSFVGGYWLGGRQGHESAVVATKARLEAQLQAQTKELQMLRQQARNKAKALTDISPTTEVGDLTFYTDLPKQSVKPQPLSQPVASPEMPSSPATTSLPGQPAAASSKMVSSIIQRELERKPPDASAAGSYYVQAASFQDANVAAGMQSKLQAAGFASRIQRADVAGRGTWYRLQVGPYASHEAADAARLALGKKMHMQGIVIRGGG
jgi:cell division protein FtsN